MTAACCETCYVLAKLHLELHQHAAGDCPGHADLGETMLLVLEESYPELLLPAVVHCSGYADHGEVVPHGRAEDHTELHQQVLVSCLGHDGHGEAGVVLALADDTDRAHVAVELTAQLAAVVERLLLLVGVLLAPAPGNEYQCVGGSSIPSWTAEDEDG